MLLDRGPGPEQVCVGPDGSVWVLDFMQERFHNMSSGDFEDAFIKAEDHETRKGLEQKKQWEMPRQGCFGSLETSWERSEPWKGCFSSLGSRRKRGLGDRA